MRLVNVKKKKETNKRFRFGFWKWLGDELEECDSFAGINLELVLLLNVPIVTTVILVLMHSFSDCSWNFLYIDYQKVFIESCDENIYRMIAYVAVYMIFSIVYINVILGFLMGAFGFPLIGLIVGARREDMKMKGRKEWNWPKIIKLSVLPILIGGPISTIIIGSFDANPFNWIHLGVYLGITTLILLGNQLKK